MILTKTTFNMIRVDDSAIIDGLEKIIEQFNTKVTKFSYWPCYANQEFTAEDFSPSTNQTLSNLLDAQSQLISQIALVFEPGYTIFIKRTPDDGYDNVEVRPTYHQTGQPTDGDYTKYLNFNIFIRKHLPEYKIERAFKDLLGKQGEHFYSAREQALQRLESVHEEFLKNTERLKIQLDERLITKTDELETRHTDRLAALEEAYKRRVEELDEREASLKNRENQIDARDNRTARRKIFEDIRETLKSRSSEFTLTEGTKKLRWFPIGATILLLFFLGISLAYTRYLSQEEKGAIDWVNVTREVAFAFAFGAAATYLIRLLQRWAQRHADEEFRLKRLSLDIDRASWLVELALEWKEEKDDEFPVELVERLGKNLFSTDGHVDEDIHPLETLVSTLLANASNLNMKTPGFEASFDRRSIRRMKKDTEKAKDAKGDSEKSPSD